MAFISNKDHVQGISILSRIIQTDLKRSLRPYGLNENNYFFIFFVNDHPGATQDDLTKTMFLDHSTITRAVIKLVQLGYLERHLDEQDKRVSHLYLTPQGQQLQRPLYEATKHAEELAFGNLTVEERRLIQPLLLKSALSHEREKEKNGSKYN
ncbi:MarR family winged helix-turn-helix transcriptional regulator [Lapidilactobacillus bayanensis]|uniref:MarR family winged helix-turn-helix transcriptional regulator n=1 Tax=Lapidilactobacillus bayanensis TaxID=2485998 RepID=UPI000F76E82B|nr:MarR family transcriptional regulator [Lapidilactobacillus bayanensis]